ncbi:MAG: DUF6587 family protein [Luteimonas sp.]
MNTSLALQYAVITIAVVVSAWVVAKKQFPTAVRRLRIALAVPLVRQGRPIWLQRLGRTIAPAILAGNAASCSGCDNCGPEPRA